jgi:hypothetical protein
MGWACGRYWGQERRIHCFDWESEGKRPIGRRGIDGRIILKWSF